MFLLMGKVNEQLETLESFYSNVEQIAQSTSDEKTN